MHRMQESMSELAFASTEQAADAPFAGCRLLVICPYPVGVAAGQRLKYEQYLEDWRRMGFVVEIAPFMDMNLWRILYEPGNLLSKFGGVVRGHIRRLRDLARIARADLVYIHMWVTPFGTTMFERLTRRLAPRLVFDLEDNVLTAGVAAIGEHPNPVVRWLKSPRKARYLVRSADHVVASSPELEDSCRGINETGAATYITSSIDTARFVPADRYGAAGPVTIGWTGTFSSRPYLDMLRPVFQELAKRVRFKLRVIGNFDYELQGVDLEVVRWSAEREVADLQALDIGVYPLPADDWVGGKSGLKAIQYMAFGLPTVATNAGNTPRVLADGETGLLVRTEQEWLAALERLIHDRDLRRRLGTAARATAVARYSLQAVADDYRRVLTAAMGSRS